jgi:hypothetical protein
MDIFGKSTLGNFTFSEGRTLIGKVKLNKCLQ